MEVAKGADRLKAAGVTATTNSGGAGKWKSALNHHFRGADIHICGDNDDVGRRHVADVARQLDGVVETVTVHRVPRPAKDISDHLAAGHTLDDIETITLGDLEEADADEAKPSSVGDRMLTVPKVSDVLDRDGLHERFRPAHFNTITASLAAEPASTPTEATSPPSTAAPGYSTGAQANFGRTPLNTHRHRKCRSDTEIRTSHRQPGFSPFPSNGLGESFRPRN